jgi:hypothetical protein
MPRSKRDVRAGGVNRSLGGTQLGQMRCLCCGRWLPRDAIAHIRRKKYWCERTSKMLVCAFCGECWSTGKVWRDVWVADLECEKD